MRSTRLLILLLLFKHPVITSAQLVERQEQGFWPDFGDLDGLSFLRGDGDLFQTPQGSDSWNTEPPPTTDTTSDKQKPPDSPEAVPAAPPAPDTSSPTEPVYKIEIHNNPSPVPLPGLEPNPPAAPPSVNEDCDPTNINDPDCSQTTDQLIFTSSCASIDPSQVVSVEAKAQNQAIQEMLANINDQNILAGKGGQGLRISTSHICDVVFFAVPLTKKQIQDIEKQPGVKSVRPNQDLHTENIPASPDPEDSNPAEIPMLTAPPNRLKERDRVVVDSSAFDDLRFISTSPNSPRLARNYYYYSKAGQEVIVFAVDTGVNTLHDDFITATGESSLLGEGIYAMDTVGLPDDYDDLGTCRTSKIVGRTMGVARKAKVMVAMVAPRASSILDVFVQISNHLNEKLLAEEKVKGYHVMSIMMQWDNEDEEINRQFDGLLNLLIKYFQIVVVVQAGMDYTYDNSDIVRWPATTAGRHDIIVVGAVNARSGRTYPFSRGGPFLSVNAPGLVHCAINRAGSRSYMRRIAVDVATAQVAGLVAYLLSLDDLGPTLRQDVAMIPRRVKNFITTAASYKRQEDDFRAIWNLMGASD